ncbi:MAG: ABC transporter permease subunit [Oscillospiraceae bacterium]|jgi:putative aldouronate transport system permease protein|nr:ABC transporter permease subunit [Oscillospiraceae bacterium]
MREGKASWRRQMSLHAMMMPGLAAVIIFAYIPMAGLVIAFQKFNPAKGLFGDNPFIGLGNFRYMFAMPNIWRVTFNTVSIATYKIVFGTLAAILVALMLNECGGVRYKRAVQTSVYFPYFLSWIILSGVLLDILSPSSGIVNLFISSLGGQPIYFMGDNKWFPFTLVATDVWKNFGFNSIVYLAAITSIDSTLYEAAAIDGAGRWKQTLHVTLPGMKMVIVLLIVLNLGNLLNAGFEQVFNLYTPQVYESGDIIDTLVYRIGLQQAQFGPSTAVGLMKSAISMVMISGSYFISWKYFDYRIF